MENLIFVALAYSIHPTRSNLLYPPACPTQTQPIAIPIGIGSLFFGFFGFFDF